VNCRYIGVGNCCYWHHTVFVAVSVVGTSLLVSNISVIVSQVPLSVLLCEAISSLARNELWDVVG
jgi:hypothetical protein